MTVTEAGSGVKNDLIVFCLFNSSFPTVEWSDTHANPHPCENFLLLSAFLLLPFYFHSFLHCVFSFQLFISEFSTLSSHFLEQKPNL
jgi:hypothetical protein